MTHVIILPENSTITQHISGSMGVEAVTKNDGNNKDSKSMHPLSDNKGVILFWSTCCHPGR